MKRAVAFRATVYPFSAGYADPLKPIKADYQATVLIANPSNWGQSRNYFDFKPPEGQGVSTHAIRLPSAPPRRNPVCLKDIIMKFRPLHDRVVVRRLTSEEKTSGGIIIPDTAQEKPSEGEAVAVGPGARNEKGDVVPLDTKAGDRVLFGKWSGTEVKIDGEDLIIMSGSDIMGIIEQPVAKKSQPTPPKKKAA